MFEPTAPRREAGGGTGGTGGNTDTDSDTGIDSSTDTATGTDTTTSTDTESGTGTSTDTGSLTTTGSGTPTGPCVQVRGAVTAADLPYLCKEIERCNPSCFASEYDEECMNPKRGCENELAVQLNCDLKYADETCNNGPWCDVQEDGYAFCSPGPINTSTGIDTSTDTATDTGTNTAP